MPKRCGSRGALIAELARLATLPDAAAISLPPGAYASEELFDLEIERIFEHEWVPVGRSEEVAEPGDYFTTELAGDPLLVVRGDDQRIRVLSNVCRHKWTEVAHGQGNARVFVCPYHAWTYARDGRLTGARYMDRTEGFRPEAYRLPELRSEEWRGFVFVNLDPDAEPLAGRLTKLDALIAGHHMEIMRRFTGGDEIWDTNWKLLVENFTEGYHTFQTHRDSLQNVTPAELTYWGDADPHFSAFYAPLAPEEPAREPCHPDLDERARRTVFMVCLYPSLVIALSPERVFYMCLIPGGDRPGAHPLGSGELRRGLRPPHPRARRRLLPAGQRGRSRPPREHPARGAGPLRGTRAALLARDHQRALRALPGRPAQRLSGPPSRPAPPRRPPSSRSDAGLRLHRGGRRLGRLRAREPAQRPGVAAGTADRGGSRPPPGEEPADIRGHLLHRRLRPGEPLARHARALGRAAAGESGSTARLLRAGAGDRRGVERQRDGGAAGDAGGLHGVDGDGSGGLVLGTRCCPSTGASNGTSTSAASITGARARFPSGGDDATSGRPSSRPWPGNSSPAAARYVDDVNAGERKATGAFR